MSFYGGKQGRTYHLVKHFEAINLNDYFEQYNSENSYAVGDKIRTQLPSESEEKYYKVIQAIEIGETNLSSKLIESTWKGMCQQFAKGGQYTDVLYGQYVIIDTKNKADPSNGIIYRRGFNYQAEGATEPTQEQWIRDNEVFEAYVADPGNGAIYIGQVVGPPGAAPIVTVASSTVNSTNLPSVVSTITTDPLGTTTQVDLNFKIPTLKINPQMAWVASHEFPFVQEKSSSRSFPFRYDLIFGIPQGIHGKSVEEVGLNDNSQFSVKYRDYQQTQEGQVDEDWTVISPYNVISTITTSQIDNTLAYQMNVDYTYNPSSTFVPTQIRTVAVNSADPSQLDFTLQTQEDIVPVSVKIPSASFKVWGIYVDFPENPPSDHTPSSTRWETGDIIRIEQSETLEPGFYMYDLDYGQSWTPVFSNMTDPSLYIQIDTSMTDLYDKGIYMPATTKTYYWEEN